MLNNVNAGAATVFIAIFVGRKLPYVNRNSFRTISFCAIGALLALVLVQAWSLWRMYADREEEFSRKVTLAMNRAAYDDLLLGNRRREVQTRTSVVSTGNIDSIKLDMVGAVSMKSLQGAGKILTIHPKVDTLKTDIVLNRDDKTRVIYQEVRMPSLTALKFNLERYDSLLTRNLLDADIDLPHSVDIIRGGGAGGPAKADSAAVRVNRGGEGEQPVITSLKDAPQIRNPRVFTSRVTTDDTLLFRVRIENPDLKLLREMFGIILTSLLMLFVVALVVLYLLRTLFRQKTLEEIRMDFTHNITHELKTPIAVAYAANDALENFGAADDTVRRAKYLAVIRSQLTALSDMVERILTMSREERDDFALDCGRIAVSELLGKLAGKFRLQADKPAEITVDVSPADLTVFADGFHLSHALGNLLDNALKYSGERVRVHVCARRDANRVVLQVADDGFGIPPAAQARIFDKFYRVPTGNLHNVKGFGLGLYYVRLIAEKHGGTVAVNSDGECGTTFTLIFPDDER